MITPMPKLTAPVVGFYAANAFYGDHLDFWDEDEDHSFRYRYSGPYILIGYDGQAWRIEHFWGAPQSPKKLGDKVFCWVAGIGKERPLEGREVTPIQFSLEEFKSEVCRRIPGNPNAVFNDETLVGEGLPRDVDIERVAAQLVEKACANVRAATSIPDVIDALFTAQSAGYRWAEGFARAQLSAS